MASRNWYVCESYYTVIYNFTLVRPVCRRHGLHTFADENAQIYTVTNVPPIVNISESTVQDLGAPSDEQVAAAAAEVGAEA